MADVTTATVQDLQGKLINYLRILFGLESGIMTEIGSKIALNEELSTIQQLMKLLKEKGTEGLEVRKIAPELEADLEKAARANGIPIRSTVIAEGKFYLMPKTDEARALVAEVAKKRAGKLAIKPTTTKKEIALDSISDINREEAEVYTFRGLTKDAIDRLEDFARTGERFDGDTFGLRTFKLHRERTDDGYYSATFTKRDVEDLGIDSFIHRAQAFDNQGITGLRNASYALRIAEQRAEMNVADGKDNSGITYYVDVTNPRNFVEVNGNKISVYSDFIPDSSATGVKIDNPQVYEYSPAQLSVIIDRMGPVKQMTYADKMRKPTREELFRFVKEGFNVSRDTENKRILEEMQSKIDSKGIDVSIKEILLKQTIESLAEEIKHMETDESELHNAAEIETKKQLLNELQRANITEEKIDAFLAEFDATKMGTFSSIGIAKGFKEAYTQCMEAYIDCIIAFEKGIRTHLEERQSTEGYLNLAELSADEKDMLVAACSKGNVVFEAFARDYVESIVDDASQTKTLMLERVELSSFREDFATEKFGEDEPTISDNTPIHDNNQIL